MNWLTKTNRNEPGIGIIIFYAGLSALMLVCGLNLLPDMTGFNMLSALILVCGSLSPKAYAVGLNYAGALHLVLISNY